MKKTIKIVIILLTVTIVLWSYYIVSSKLFTRKIKNIFPELQAQSTTLFIPWPFGPKWISNVPADHPLYTQSSSGSGGTIKRNGYTVTVMASDGTVIAEKENK